MDKLLELVLVGGIAWIVAAVVLRITRAINPPRSRHSANKVSDLETDLAACEQDLVDAVARIEVLEKIVTDDRYQLRKDIDALDSENKRAG